MGSGFSKLKKQARQIEQQVAKMQEDLKNKEFTGTSPGQLVKIVIQGDKQLKSIQILPDCVRPDDIEGLQDLIKAAFEDAYKQLNASETNQLPTELFGF